METSLSFFITTSSGHSNWVKTQLDRSTPESARSPQILLMVYEDRKQVHNALTSGLTVKHIGGAYSDDEHATDCIDNDRMFSALNEFAPIKSRFYIGFRGSLDTLNYQ